MDRMLLSNEHMCDFVYGATKGKLELYTCWCELVENGQYDMTRKRCNPVRGNYLTLRFFKGTEIKGLPIAKKKSRKSFPYRVSSCNEI